MRENSAAYRKCPPIMCPNTSTAADISHSAQDRRAPVGAAAARALPTRRVGTHANTRHPTSAAAAAPAAAGTPATRQRVRSLRAVATPRWRVAATPVAAVLAAAAMPANGAAGKGRQTMRSCTALSLRLM